MADQKNSRGGDDELRLLLSGPAVGVPHAADEETRQSFVERRLAQREHYGQFRATGPIYVPGTGTLAFATHAQVPMEHVEKWELERAGMVARVATPEDARAGRLTPKHAKAAGYHMDDLDADDGPQNPGDAGPDDGPQNPGDAGPDAAAPTENPSGAAKASASAKK